MDVVVWLRSLGLGKYEATFRENEIDETVLRSLTHENLKELGVASREARYLELARSTSDPDVQERLVAIARHYRSLAKIEQSIADQRPNKRVAANPHGFAMTEFTSVQQ